MSWLLSPVGAITSVDHVGDVTITAVASGEVLVWNGSAWVNNTLAEAGIGSGDGDLLAANDLSDVADAPTARSNLGVDAAGTDNSTDVTLAGQDYLSLSGQQITANKLAIDDLADGTDGELITWDTSGVAAAVAVGTDTHVLTSNGIGAAPTFQAAPAGGSGGADMLPGQFNGLTNQTFSTTIQTVDLQTETYDPDSNYAVASDIVTVSAAGYYLIAYEVYGRVASGSGNARATLSAWMTKNGTSTIMLGSYGSGFINEANNPLDATSAGSTFLHLLAANDTVRIRAQLNQNTDMDSAANKVHLTLLKVRDV